MIPVMLAALGGALLFAHLAVTQPRVLAEQRKLAGDVAAANFWAYRSGVVAYLNANPGTSGTAPDASLTFPLGHIRNPVWTHTVQSGTLYVYSTSVPSPDALEAIAGRGGRSMLIGTKSAGGTMTSLTGAASGFTLPSELSAAPTGAVVVIGN